MTELLKVYEQALKEIEKFGHSHGHGHGYTCANIAEKALKMHLKESLECEIADLFDGWEYA
jgi:hypothetical protein